MSFVNWKAIWLGHSTVGIVPNVHHWLDWEMVTIRPCIHPLESEGYREIVAIGSAMFAIATAGSVKWAEQPDARPACWAQSITANGVPTFFKANDALYCEESDVRV